MGSNDYFLDANVILRFLIKDNFPYYKKATNIFKQISDHKVRAFITTLVLHEVSYVMKSVYSVEIKVISRKLKRLLRLENLNVLDLPKDYVIKALVEFGKTKIDFPDCVYKQIVLENDMKFLSFDEEFKKIKMERFEEV